MSRQNASHFENTYCYWSYCVNSKDYAKETFIPIEEGDEELEMQFLQEEEPVTKNCSGEYPSSDEEAGKSTFCTVSLTSSKSTSLDYSEGGSIGGGIIGGRGIEEQPSEEDPDRVLRSDLHRCGSLSPSSSSPSPVVVQFKQDVVQFMQAQKLEQPKSNAWCDLKIAAAAAGAAL